MNEKLDSSGDELMDNSNEILTNIKSPRVSDVVFGVGMTRVPVSLRLQKFFLLLIMAIGICIVEECSTFLEMNADIPIPTWSLFGIPLGYLVAVFIVFCGLIVLLVSSAKKEIWSGLCPICGVTVYLEQPENIKFMEDVTCNMKTGGCNSRMTFKEGTFIEKI